MREMDECLPYFALVLGRYTIGLKAQRKQTD